MDIAKIKDGLELISGGLAKLDEGPFDYTLRCLLAARETLLARYAPFKIGDRVQLARTPIIDGTIAWGWMGSRHFLKEGAVGTVRSSDVRPDGEVVFDVEFDAESWIDTGGEEHPVSDKHTYRFTEEMLAK